MDLRPTSNAAAVLKIIHFLLRREFSGVGAPAAGTADKRKNKKKLACELVI
jgi:hypothetical protein